MPQRITLHRFKPRQVRRPLQSSHPNVRMQRLRGSNVVMLERSKSKFGAISCSYNGRRFDSRKEAAYAEELDLLRRAKEPEERVVDVQYQVRVPLEVNGQLVTTYICDFFVTFADGHTEWHETKGFETPEWRIKEKLFRALYPDRIFNVIR